METATFYKPSGKVPFMGIIHSLIWGILTGALMSYLYVLACNHIPFIYLNLIIWVGFVALPTVAVAACIHKCKIRNSIVASILGGIVGLATLYIVWAVYCSFMFGGFSLDKFFRFIMHPGEMWTLIDIVSQTGTWSIGHFGSSMHENVTGFFLWIVWIGEAAGIVLVPIVFLNMTSKMLFSETQNRWFDKKDTKKLEREAFAGSNEDFKAKLLHYDFSSLLELKANSSSLQAHTKIEISSSGSPTENYLSVGFVKPAPTKKKPDAMEEKKIVDNMVLSDMQYNKLKEGLGL